MKFRSTARGVELRINEICEIIGRLEWRLQCLTTCARRVAGINVSANFHYVDTFSSCDSIVYLYGTLCNLSDIPKELMTMIF